MDSFRVFGSGEAAPNGSAAASHLAWASEARAGASHAQAPAPFTLRDLQEAQALLERAGQAHTHSQGPFSLSSLQEAQALLEGLKASGALLGGGGAGLLAEDLSPLAELLGGGGGPMLTEQRTPSAALPPSPFSGAQAPGPSSSWGNSGPPLLTRAAASASTALGSGGSSGGVLGGGAGARELEPCPAGCTCLLCSLGGVVQASNREALGGPNKRKRQSMDEDGSTCQLASPTQQLEGQVPHGQQGQGLARAVAHSREVRDTPGLNGLVQEPSATHKAAPGGAMVPAPKEPQAGVPRPGASLASRLASIVRRGAATPPAGARPGQALPAPQSNLAALSAAQAQLQMQRTGKGPSPAKGQVEKGKALAPQSSALQPWLHHRKKDPQAEEETSGEASGSSALVVRQGSGISRQSSSMTMCASPDSLGSEGLVLPKELLGAPPELADLTSLDDLPWLAPDLFAEWGIPAAALERQEGGLKLLVESLAAGQGPEGEGPASCALASLDKARRAMGEADGPIELRLRKRLLALAEAVATKDEMQAAIYTRILEADVSPDGTPMQRICYYMLEALKLRQKGEGLNVTRGPYRMPKQVGTAVLDFTAVMPYVEFWITGMNCAIVDAAAGRGKVHIIDFGMWSWQWVHVFRKLQTIYSYVQAGARQQQQEQQQGLDEGQSAHVDRVQIRFTAVDLPPESGRGTGPSTSSDELQLELMLAAAETGVDLCYEVVCTSLENFDPSVVLRKGGAAAEGTKDGGREGWGAAQERGEAAGPSGREREDEALVVCLCTHLDTLPDSTVLRSNPRDTFLRKLVGMRPDVIAVSNIEKDVNTPFYMRRFEACLDLFHKYFLSHELGAPRDSMSRKMFEGKVLVRGIHNLVVCDGAMIHSRYEGLRKMAKRMRHVGLEPRALPPVAAEMLQSMLRKYPPGFAVRPCLQNSGAILSWEGNDLNGISAWKVAKPAEEVDDF